MNTYISTNSEQYFAFNIWDIESAKAVMDAAAQWKKNLILQTSTKAFQQMDKEEMRFFVANYSGNTGIRAYLHLDHCKKMNLIQEAARCKWDSVMIDASELPLEENIRLTNEVCDAMKEYEIPVEAEIGQISGAEEDVCVKEAGVARFEDVCTFVKRTNADMLAVAVGTAHGIYQGAPKLHYDLLERIMRFTHIPLVIHGGTGLNDETFRKLLSYKNVKKINISTDVKLAYRSGIYESIRKGELEETRFDPLKVTGEIHDSICKMAKEKLALLCGNKNSGEKVEK